MQKATNTNQRRSKKKNQNNCRQTNWLCDKILHFIAVKTVLWILLERLTTVTPQQLSMRVFKHLCCSYFRKKITRKPCTQTHTYVCVYSTRSQYIRNFGCCVYFAKMFQPFFTANRRWWRRRRWYSPPPSSHQKREKIVCVLFSRNLFW